MSTEVEARPYSGQESEAETRYRESASGADRSIHREPLPAVLPRMQSQVPANTYATDVLRSTYEKKGPSTVRFTANLKTAMRDAIGPKEAKEIRDRYRLRGQPADLSSPTTESKTTTIISVTSDRHLNAGADEGTKQINPLENSLPSNDIQDIRVAFRHMRAAAQQASFGQRGRLSETIDRLESMVLGDATVSLTPDDWTFLRTHKECRLVLADIGDRLDFMKIITPDDDIAFPDGLSTDYSGPRNTPRNVVAQMQIAAKGHPNYFALVAATILSGNTYDVVVGNHDEQLLHPYVWAAFVDLVKEAARARFFPRDLIAEKEMAPAERAAIDSNIEQQIDAALKHLHKNLFKLYGDALHDHGHRFIDKYNMIDDQLGELVNPTPIDQEMPASFGFYGVRKGYNGVASLNPIIDHLSGKEWLKWALAPANWPSVIKMARGFMFALKQGGYKVSRGENIPRDLGYIKRVVETTDIIERFNADLPSGTPPVDANYVEGFLATLYFAGPRPFLSNFKAGTGLFTRMATYAYLRLKGEIDTRKVDEVLVDSTAALQKYAIDNNGPIINRRVAGHTHAPRQEVHLTATGQAIDYLNNGSGLYQNTDDPSSLTFAKHDHGNVVSHMGTTSDGEPWMTTHLDRIVDSSGTSMPGAMVGVKEHSPQAARRFSGCILRNYSRASHSRPDQESLL